MSRATSSMKDDPPYLGSLHFDHSVEGWSLKGVSESFRESAVLLPWSRWDIINLNDGAMQNTIRCMRSMALE